ncbi:hypothetical protein [Streptomyces hoynatensis]|nr:hypothetical protein [Streptomyces hoynatensis]
MFHQKSCKRRGVCTGCMPFARRPCTAWQGPRPVVRLGRTVLTYRSCLHWSVAAAAAAVVLLGAGAVVGLVLPLGAAAVVVVLVWLLAALRVLRLDAACPAPGGGPGPGGAGLREPRRPKPHPPAGVVGLPLPDGGKSGAAALA